MVGDEVGAARNGLAHGKTSRITSDGVGSITVDGHDPLHPLRRPVGGVYGVKKIVYRLRGVPRAGGLEEIEAMLRTGKLSVSDGRPRDCAQRIDKRACLLNRDHRVGLAVQDKEWRGVGTNPQQRRGGTKDLERLPDAALNDVALDEQDEFPAP